MKKLKALIKPLALLGLLAAVFVSVIEVPVMQRAWVRGQVASSVFEVRGKTDGGGGTGFQVVGPSGTPYIVTNSHVCEYAQKAAEDQNFVLVRQSNHWLKRRVLEVDGEADLCLLEGAPGVPGLRLGSDVKIGDRVAAIGHPHLGPTTLSDGEVVAFTDTEIPHHIMQSGDVKKDKFFGASPQSCNLPKNFIKKQEFFLFGIISLGEMNVCMIKETEAIQTNVTIFGGNSGSPLVDMWGNVVGVVFAADTSTNWGFAVNLGHLKHLLKDY